MRASQRPGGWLRQLDGHPGRARRPSSLPEPPDYLTDAQKERWRELVASIDSNLRPADASTLERAAIAWATLRETTTTINRVGHLIKRGDRFEENPLIAVRDHAARALASVSTELGLSPTARARMTTTPEDGDGSL